MRNGYKLSIKEPCSQNFENFRLTHSGGYCESCAKEVIDFTKMTEWELISYFKNQHGKVCGRFEPSQLKIYHEDTRRKVNLGWKIFSLGAIGVASLFPFSTVAQQKTERSSVGKSLNIASSVNTANDSNQERTITGKVVDEYRDSLPGVNIVLKGTNQGTVTDMEGNFILTADIEKGDILVFSFVGFATEEYKFKGDLSESIMTLNLDMIGMSCDILGEVAVDEIYSSKKGNIFKKIRNLFK